MDRGAWQTTVDGITKESDMTEKLNNNKTENFMTWAMYSEFQKVDTINADWNLI